MKRVLLWGLVLTMNQAMGQSKPVFSPNESLAQVSVFPWTGENGLISNNVTSSLQAKSGLIWITTFSGIMRFDGKCVEVYDRKNITFLTIRSLEKPKG
jgi:ligand-binding sensor domain-containing protein